MGDYKYTLNLPNTKFSMRANLVENEPIILKKWYEDDLYKVVRYAKKGKKIFFLHDGPPYANGNIHIGHAVNKILKDIIVKFKGLMGYDAPYIPGWDCHGLPIELKVEQLLGTSSIDNINVSEFQLECRNYAAEQVVKQKKDFIRLGILGDWNDPYLTMDFMIEANVIRTLSKVIANGLIYRGIKPVHWCIHCRSVLAEVEIEYCDHVSPSIYLTFLAKNFHEILNKFGVLNYEIPVSIIVWTTTPWSLPDNCALSLHPNFDYQLIEYNKHGFIVASFAVEKITNFANFVNYKLLGSIKGNELEFTKFHHPFMKFDVPVVLSNHVSWNIGSGIVHIAPAHGVDDYIIAQRYQLKFSDSITSNGCFVDNIFSEINGIQCFKANSIIINLLHRLGNLFYTNIINHSYPYCWRHKYPVIFRTTSQWFVGLSNNYLRQLMLTEIEKVTWMPEKEKLRMKLMIDNRPDWCISRQRVWGVPIPIFVHKYTNFIHPRTVEFMEFIAELVETRGIQAWWDINLVDFLGKDAPYYEKVSDVLDVWFDSGSTLFSVLFSRSDFSGDMIDLCVEGSDQYRGWFMSSLMLSVAINKQVSYRQILTHGFVVDIKGHKMSKSLGNVVSPQDIVNKFGADVLRLWVASIDYTNDMVISSEILKRVVDIYRRIRNTVRFLLGNLSDFDPSVHIVDASQMVILDKWAISQAYIVQKKILSAYNSYNFHNVVKFIMYFCSVQMGAFYLDIIKDRQYTIKCDSIARRSCQTALYYIVEALVRWISPIISFTADEIWCHIPGKRAKYVFTEEWYNNLFDIDESHVMNNDYWTVMLNVRNVVNKALDQAIIKGFIKGSLESSVVLYASSNLAIKLRELRDELCFFLLTSYAVVIDDFNNDCKSTILYGGFPGLKILLNKAHGQKCQRCWRYTMDVGNYKDYPDLCSRCFINIFGIGECRKFV